MPFRPEIRRSATNAFYPAPYNAPQGGVGAVTLPFANALLVHSHFTCARPRSEAFERQTAHIPHSTALAAALTADTEVGGTAAGTLRDFGLPGAVGEVVQEVPFPLSAHGDISLGSPTR